MLYKLLFERSSFYARYCVFVLDDNNVINSYRDNKNSISSSLSSSFSDEMFQGRLAKCFANNDLTHVQCNDILSVLRTYICFSALSKES